MVRFLPALKNGASSLKFGENIVSFPTKAHWRDKSVLEHIQQGLVDLRLKIPEYGITSIAIPKLGCGLGGLNWDDVKLLIEQELGGLDQVRILCCL